MKPVLVKPLLVKPLLARYGTAFAAVALFVFFAIAARNFLALGNLVGIAKHISHVAILGIGFSLALIAAELDLSFANVCSLAAVTTGVLVHRGIQPGHATGFTSLGRGEVFAVPALVWWMVTVSLAALFWLKQTRGGFRLVCTGENVEAARLAGLPVKRIKVVALTLSGGAAGLAAVLLTASLSSASATMAGDFLLTAFAAVMLGMTMGEPGHANIPGTLVGAFTIGMLGNGLVLLGAPYYVQDICLGCIIIGSVAVSASALTRAAFDV